MCSYSVITRISQTVHVLICIVLLVNGDTNDASNDRLSGEQSGSQQCIAKSDCVEIAPDENMALVLYKEENLALASFYKPERQFTFLGHTLTISQDWAKRGVAAVVWDAAVVLSEYLATNPETVRNLRVLELGAGTGLAGMVAAVAGGDVTVTERVEVLDHLHSIVSANLDPTTYKLTVAPLDWTEEHSDQWGQFDIILGADIVYIEETFPDLLRTLLHFSSKDTLVLLSCKIRYKKDSKFLSMMGERFTVKKIYFDSPRDIHIYSAKRNS